MNKIYMFFCFFVGLLVLNICIFIKSNTITSSFRNVCVVSNFEKKIDEREEEKYKILAYIPDSDFSLLNETVNSKINEYIDNFKKDVDLEVAQVNHYYTLTIFYDTYEYKNYLSYVFRIEYYTGGAHPGHYIWTVNYDKDKNEIIDISSLISKNSDVLDIFSKISREELSINKRIVDTSMMMLGTIPKVENFSNFVFSNDGLILFFPQYQVAPYSSGEFMVTIPYDKIF